MGEKTQPVGVHSFQDKFELYSHGKYPTTPAKTGRVICKGDNKVTLSKEEHNTYKWGVRNMLYMMRCSRTDILNVVSWMFDGDELYNGVIY